MTARRAAGAAVAGLAGAWALGCAAMYGQAFAARIKIGQYGLR